MEIKLNEEALAAAINEASNKAITDAVSSYEVRKALTERATRAILSSAVSKAIEDGLESAGMDRIVKAISAELVRVVGAMAVRSVRDSAETTLFLIRKGQQSRYMTTKDEETIRAEVRRDLKLDASEVL